MAAPPKNQFWKARSSHGRNPIFATPEKLWAAACEYFEWVDRNPLTEPKTVVYQGEIRVEHVPKMRAMTISGLCIFLDISRTTWADYRTRAGFADVAERIEDIIRTQKLEGAAADLLNAAIIQRELGMAERPEQGPSAESMQDEVLDARIAELLAKAGIGTAAEGTGKAADEK